MFMRMNNIYIIMNVEAMPVPCAFACSRWRGSALRGRKKGD
jgi:hypothetical protein